MLKTILYIHIYHKKKDRNFQFSLPVGDRFISMFSYVFFFIEIIEIENNHYNNTRLKEKLVHRNKMNKIFNHIVILYHRYYKITVMNELISN